MRLPGLDLLRIVAALALVICHAGFWLGPFGIPDSLWMLIGHVAVELFLVSMGFLVAQRLLAVEHKVPILRNWVRSAFRLWPLYLLLLALNLVFAPEGEPISEWPSYIFLVQNLAWPHPNFFGEAWIVAAAALILLVVPVLCRLLQTKSFARGVLVLMGLLLTTSALRGLLVWAGNPSFDEGVRKILIARLDLPIYAVLAAWLWVHRYAAIIQWRAALALLGGVGLLATAWIHLTIPLDQSDAARTLLFPLCDAAWLMLLPWVCSLQMPDRLSESVRVVASSAYAGLLTHVTILRIGGSLGMPLLATSPMQGILMLSSFVLLASGVAILVSLVLDQPLLGLRERWFPLTP
ncbi:MAG: acyltransferase family protein [Dokdonella sp.]